MQKIQPGTSVTTIALAFLLAVPIAAAMSPAPNSASTSRFSVNLKLPVSQSAGNSGCEGYVNYCTDIPADCPCYAWAATVSTPAGKHTGVNFYFQLDTGSIEETNDGDRCYAGRFRLTLQGENDSEDWLGPGSECITLNGKVHLSGGAILDNSKVYSGGTARALGKVSPTTGALVIQISGQVLK
jgi:hypothetical protein